MAREQRAEVDEAEGEGRAVEDLGGGDGEGAEFEGHFGFGGFGGGRAVRVNVLECAGWVFGIVHGVAVLFLDVLSSRSSLGARWAWWGIFSGEYLEWFTRLAGIYAHLEISLNCVRDSPLDLHVKGEAVGSEKNRKRENAFCA